MEKLEGMLHLYHVKSAEEGQSAIEYHAREKDLYPTEIEAREASLVWLDERRAAVSDYIANHYKTSV